MNKEACFCVRRFPVACITILFFAFTVCHPVRASEQSSARSIAWLKPFVNNTSNSNYASMTVNLMQKLKNGALIKRASISPVISDSEKVFFVKICGSIGTVNNKTIFAAELYDAQGKRLWEVTFDLGTVDPDDALEMVQKKTAFYFEKSGISKLIVTSNPSGCALLANDAPTGTTPLQIQLTSGVHRIELQKRYFKTLYDTMRLQPAEAVDKHYEMDYRGLPVGSSIVISSIVSLGTFIVAISELSAHQSYKAVGENSPQSEFDMRFKRWHTLNSVRNSLFVLSGISWTISGAVYYKNKRIKKKAYFY